MVSIQGHSKGDMAPGMKGPGILEYKVAHNLIRSHAKAYRVYQNEFAETQQGIVFQISRLYKISTLYTYLGLSNKYSY